jgi:hypothetical protein
VLSLPSRPQPAATCIMNNRLPACTPILFLARLLMFSLLLGLPFSSAKTITPLFDGITATGTVSDASPAFFVLNVSATLWQYDRWCVNSLFLALLPVEPPKSAISCPLQVGLLLLLLLPLHHSHTRKRRPPTRHIRSIQFPARRL